MSRPNHCDPCPFAACLACPYKGGTWGSTDEQPEPKPTRKEV